MGIVLGFGTKDLSKGPHKHRNYYKKMREI